MLDVNLIKLIRENLSVGNPTAIFISFTLITLSIVFPFICYAELTKKKVKKQNKKKGNNKQKCNKEPQQIVQQSSKSNQKKTPSKPFIPPLDTEGSEDEEKQIPEKSEQFVPSTKHIQGLSFEIDKNDSGGWKVVGDKKSKRSYTEASLTSVGSEETEKNSNKPKSKQVRRRKPINKVPGMID
ncbi:Uncharacterized protein GY17_00000257 [Cryptosporidium hominis]|uniref:Uncharacterized protein n=1 Tax=Cryptosporidium hominis TaxID=237895 RepID=A0ABX5BIH1_CRYHO|nr:Uncharacterized protein GY17_00000257 [Cryptosporidium hominis]|eukprot:PPS97786.1 Uncharacterized protein GY17_00000257 [Cryptosporidium hominis]